MLTYNTRLMEYGKMIDKVFPYAEIKITDSKDLECDGECWSFLYSPSENTMECAFNNFKENYLTPEEKMKWYYDAICAFEYWGFQPEGRWVDFKTKEILKCWNEKADFLCNGESLYEISLPNGETFIDRVCPEYRNVVKTLSSMKEELEDGKTYLIRGIQYTLKNGEWVTEKITYSIPYQVITREYKGDNLPF